MNEIDFKNWLSVNNTTRKVISDIISRLKRLEYSLGIDIDNEFEKDQCKHLFTFFANSGRNEYSSSIKNCNLPIGKYYLSSYKLALKKYTQFLEMTKGSY